MLDELERGRKIYILYSLLAVEVVDPCMHSIWVGGSVDIRNFHGYPVRWFSASRA
jgi:hypothetical protein